MDKIRECSIFFSLRLKLIVRDKVTIVLFGITVVLFLFMGNVLFHSAGDKSRIPVGITDEDHSKVSGDLIKRIKQVNGLKVIEGTGEELNKELENQKIEGIFIIKEGYEKKIKGGHMLDLVTFSYVKENTMAALLPDIFAGEMLYDICLSKGMNLYYNLEEGVMVKERIYTQEEYIGYIGKLAENPEFAFTFQIETLIKNIPDNSIIYVQITFGILGILLAFIILFMSSNSMIDKESGIGARLRTTLIKNPSKIAGDILAVMGINSILNIGFTGIVCWTFKTLSIREMGSVYLLLWAYTLAYTLLFCALSHICKHITSFQTAGSFLVILGGFAGFLHIVEGLLPMQFLKFLELLPNSWFIKRITDIIV